MEKRTLVSIQFGPDHYYVEDTTDGEIRYNASDEPPSPYSYTQYYHVTGAELSKVLDHLEVKREQGKLTYTIQYRQREHGELSFSVLSRTDGFKFVRRFDSLAEAKAGAADDLIKQENGHILVPDDDGQYWTYTLINRSTLGYLWLFGNVHCEVCGQLSEGIRLMYSPDDSQYSLDSQVCKFCVERLS